MNKDEIKAAIKAQREIVAINERLDNLRSVGPIPSYAKFWGEPQKQYLRDKYQDNVKALENMIREQKRNLDPVLQWAETAPEEIRQIIYARVTDMKPWEEISLELCNSSVPNTAYMKLKRFLDSCNMGHKMTD